MNKVGLCRKILAKLRNLQQNPLGSRRIISQESDQSPTVYLPLTSNTIKLEASSLIMPKYIGALDQGTTSTRFILFRTSDGKDVARANRTHQQFRPHEGWLEHDANEIMKCVYECIDECVEESGVNVEDVLAIGVTNQRETIVCWDPESGQPVCNAIVWNDNRTGKTAEILKEVLGDDEVRKKTGLRITSYFSGVKLKWLMDNDEEIERRVTEGCLRCGTVDSWIVWNLTGSFVTDVTNAGRTMMMNLESCEWDEEILEKLNVEKKCLPVIRSSSEVYGEITKGKLKGVAVAAILGDQQAALVGQAGFSIGDCKNTYGTGSFFILNTGGKARDSASLLTTPAYKLGPNSPTVYALEGSVESAGRVAEWLCESLDFAKDVGEIEALARKSEGVTHVMFVPAFNELYAPFWDGSGRACIVNMTLSTNKHDIAYAAIQGIALRVCDVLKAAADDMGVDSNFSLRVDGGATKNELLLQMQADLANVCVVRPKQQETTALGAAYAAGLAMSTQGIDTGVFATEKAFKDSWEEDIKFKPNMDQKKREDIMTRWEAAVEKSRNSAS